MAYILSREIAASVKMEAIPVKMSITSYTYDSRRYVCPKYNTVLIAMYKGTVRSPTSKSATAKLIYYNSEIYIK